MKKILLYFLPTLFCLPTKAQLFSQDFQGSATLSNYVSATPSVGQFTSIGTPSNNAGSIVSNALRFSKTGNSTGWFARNTNFPGPPSLLQVSFDFTLSGNTNALIALTQANFFVGSSLGDGGTDPGNASVHSKFAFSFNNTNGGFYVRKLVGAANGNLYTGKQTITFLINNSGAAKSYTAPNGLTETIANDTWDLWVGNTKEFNDIVATTASVNLDAFRFSYPSGSENATIDFDNIIISELATLPISLTTFTAKPVDKIILLTWETASEKNNKYFELQRSGNGKSFTTITTLDGAGDSDSEKSYSFVDENHFAGTNYYKLVQYDFNGQSTSKTITVDSKLETAQVFVSTTSSSVDLNISSPNNAKAKIYLYDLEGSKLSEKSLGLTKGNNVLSFTQSLTPGIYFVSIITEGAKVNAKFAKW